MDASRPLTLDEATLLAAVQYDNFQDEGAEFVVNTAFRASGDSLTMRGEVDWRNHRGHALVMGQGTESGISEIYWTDDVVAERWPSADALLTSMGFDGVEFIARPPDPENRLLDRALAVLMGLAAEQRDNTQLIQQKVGSSFLRVDELRGAATTVLRYGERNVYWLDASTNRMLRFEGDAEAGGAPVLVDILARGAQNVGLPDVGMLVEVDQVKELYDALLEAARNPEGSGR